MNNLKKIREDKKLTQLQISTILEIGKSTYNKYEYEEREMNYKILYKISKLFNVSIDYLLNNNFKEEPITAEENELLTKFKKLNKEQKQIIIATINNFF